MTNLTSSIQVSEEVIEAIQEAAMQATEMYVGTKMVRAILEQAAAMRSKDHSIAVDDVREGDGKIMLHIAAASREHEMWERRFRVLYHAHPSYRSADEDGPWGLRDFLRYAGEVCGFDDPLTAIGSQSK